MAYVALGSYVALGAAASAPPLIKIGSKGEHVLRAQELLEVKLGPPVLIPKTGVFDKPMVTLVEEFQRRFKDADGKALVVDGKIGRKTWSALLDMPRVPPAASGGAGSSSSSSSSSAKTKSSSTPPPAGPGPQASVKGGGFPLWMVAGAAGGLLWAFWPQISGKKKS